jgi:hypothetical protein
MRKLLSIAALVGFLAFGACTRGWRAQDVEMTQKECGPFEIHHFETIEKKLRKLPRGAVLVLDCSKTLIVPKDRLLRRGHWAKTLAEALGREPSDSELRRFKLLVELQAEKELVHPRWPALLTECAERGVRICVLTKHPTGEQIAGLPSFEEVRSRHLRDLGFRFHRWAPLIDFEQMQMDLPGREIGWYQGILFAPNGEKGPVIDALLENLIEPATEICIVDDSFFQAQSMASSIREMSTPGAVLLYRSDTMHNLEPLNENDQHRLRAFLSSGVWPN